jgi:hypothetical protein
MRILKPIHATAGLAASLVLTLSLSALAVIDPANIPSVDLTDVVPRSGVQAVEDIPDRDKLSIFINEALLEQKMSLPGWDSSTNQLPNRDLLLEAFAVRTTQNPASLQVGNSIFYSGAGVGRSGVWELQKAGEAFAFIDGRPLKGLTIKGYGGNAGKGYQPNGSLDAAEAYRDTVLSRILMEKGADTYIGALTVVRPTGMANYIRLSRSSLRMNDLMDRSGTELRATVEHLSTLIADELGKRPNPQEFAEWLVERSARTLAHKEHARVTASNHNKDNFGIAELVDFGEAKYDPLNFKHGFDVVGNGTGWQKGLKPHPIEAAQNIAKEYGFAGNFEALFDKTYKERVELLITRDAARVNLDLASEKELKELGLSELAARKIVKLQFTLPYGILTVEDVLSNLSLTDSEKKTIRRQATTSLLRMPDGHILASSVIAEVGGNEGLREVFKAALSGMTAAELADPAKVQTAIAQIAKEKMTERGVDRFLTSSNWTSSYGVNVPELLSRHMSQQISSSPQEWASRQIEAKKFKTKAVGDYCEESFL